MFVFFGFGGVRHARKMIQWIIFSAERAGRPWVSRVST